jgi:hypothetical protein
MFFRWLRASVMFIFFREWPQSQIQRKKMAVVVVTPQGGTTIRVSENRPSAR